MPQRKASFLLLLLLIGSRFLLAQLPPLYPFLQDDTLLRKNFLSASQQKKTLLLATVEKPNAKIYKNLYEEQFDNINELWKSSRPVTSPKAHGYLQAIVKKIVDANPELKGTDARVVFSRDWWPNAVSMGDGTIAINAGLVLYLHNEAELAFIVGHELAHYYLEHTPKAIKKYVETVTSESYQAELKRIQKTEFGANKQLEELARNTVFNSRRHSRDKETEADRQAFIFLKKTGYDCSAIGTCLALLDKVDDSLLYKPVDLEQTLNFKEYPFKKKWIQKESAIFSALDDNSGLTQKEKDSLKTHPDCSKRIASLADSISKATGPNKKLYLVDEPFFAQLKKDFFMEITEECYREKKLGRNLYNNLILLRSNQNAAVASFSIARCLNDIFDSQKNHQLGLRIDTETKGSPDNYNLLMRMLGRLRLNEIASINYAFCLQQSSLMQGYPGFEEETKKAKQRLQE